jgi:hypothetical protein
MRGALKDKQQYATFKRWCPTVTPLLRGISTPISSRIFADLSVFGSAQCRGRVSNNYDSGSNERRLLLHAALVLVNLKSVESLSAMKNCLEIPKRGAPGSFYRLAIFAEAFAQTERSETQRNGQKASIDESGGRRPCDPRAFTPKPRGEEKRRAASGGRRTGIETDKRNAEPLN